MQTPWISPNTKHPWVFPQPCSYLSLLGEVPAALMFSTCLGKEGRFGFPLTVMKADRIQDSRGLCLILCNRGNGMCCFPGRKCQLQWLLFLLGYAAGEEGSEGLRASALTLLWCEAAAAHLGLGHQHLKQQQGSRAK